MGDGLSQFNKKFMLKAFFIFILCLGFSFFAQAKIVSPSLIDAKITPSILEEMKDVKGYWIEVQIPQRRVLLVKHKDIIQSYPVSVGMPDHPSPIGKRKFDRIIWNPWWFPPQSEWVEDPTPVPPRDSKNPLGEIKIPLGYDAFLLHGTKSISSIGGWASHGCIRMLFEDIFSLTQILMNDYSEKSALEMMSVAELNPGRQFNTILSQEVPVVFSYETVRLDKEKIYLYPDFYKRNENYDELLLSILDEATPYNYKIDRKRVRKITKSLTDKVHSIQIDTLMVKK